VVGSTPVVTPRQNSAELPLIGACVPVQLFQHPLYPAFAFEFQLIRFLGDLYSASFFKFKRGLEKLVLKEARKQLGIQVES
jgi:hypothetical protein